MLWRRKIRVCRAVLNKTIIKVFVKKYTTGNFKMSRRLDEVVAASNRKTAEERKGGLIKVEEGHVDKTARDWFDKSLGTRRPQAAGCHDLSTACGWSWWYSYY